MSEYTTGYCAIHGKGMPKEDGACMACLEEEELLYKRLEAEGLELQSLALGRVPGSEWKLMIFNGFERNEDYPFYQEVLGKRTNFTEIAPYVGNENALLTTEDVFCRWDIQRLNNI